MKFIKQCYNSNFAYKLKFYLKNKRDKIVSKKNFMFVREYSILYKIYLYCSKLIKDICTALLIYVCGVKAINFYNKFNYNAFLKRLSYTYALYYDIYINRLIDVLMYIYIRRLTVICILLPPFVTLVLVKCGFIDNSLINKLLQLNVEHILSEPKETITQESIDFEAAERMFRKCIFENVDLLKLREENINAYDDCLLKVHNKFFLRKK